VIKERLVERMRRWVDAQPCHVCGAKPERVDTSIFYEPFAHRCSHGEPCHAGEITASDTCSKCPLPRRIEVQA
jgi:hypothetical protein